MPLQITITGYPCSGKSSIGKMLSSYFKIPFYSIGSLRRDFAKKKGLSLEELNNSKEDYDTEFDNYQKSIKGDFILDSRLGHFFHPKAFSIFLIVSLREGASRLISDNREEEKASILEKGIFLLKKRIEIDKKRYLKLYNYNPYSDNSYDLIIDTTNLTKEEVFELIKNEIKKRFFNNQ